MDKAKNKKSPKFYSNQSVSTSLTTNTRFRMSQTSRIVSTENLLSSPAAMSVTEDLLPSPRRKISLASHKTFLGWSPMRGSLSYVEPDVGLNENTSSTSAGSLYTPASIDTASLYQSDLSSPGLFRTPRKRKTNIISSTIDLCNTIMGTGIVSLPYAFSTIGLGLGTVVVLVSLWATWFSLRLLVQSAQNAHGSGIISGRRRNYPYSLLVNNGEPSFSSIAQASLSPTFSAICDVTVVLACLGFACSYLVSIGDCMPHLMIGIFGKENLESFYNGIFISRAFWMLAFLVIIAPLCFAKSVDDFPWFSGLALSCAIYLSLLIIIEFFLATKPFSTYHILWFRMEWKTFDCIPIFIFAFTCHQNIFTIYKDLDASYINGDPLDPATLNHIYSVIDLSVIGVGTIYMLVGWLGFILLGDDTGIIILDNYDTNLFVSLGRFLYCLLAALSMPIQVHPCRLAIESLACTLRYFSPRISGYTQLTNPNTFAGSPSQEAARRYILSFAILVVSYTFAFAIPNLDEVLALAGATGGVTMCFVLPTLFHIMLADFDNEKQSMAIALWISTLGAICGAAQVVALFISARS